MKKINKIGLVILFTVVIFFITGCSEVEKSDLTSNATGTTTVKETIVDEDFNDNGTGTLVCVTDAQAAEGIEVDISYTVDYKNGNILKLRSVQKVISGSNENLDLYEDAFKGIAENYNGLKYYDVSLVRDSNSVTYDVVINYDKIDTKKLLDIEGEEDNIIKNGDAKLSLWLDLASQFGTTCEEA